MAINRIVFEWPPTMTLREVRSRLLTKRSAGTQCPACGQHVKEYRRKVNARMARTLIAMYRAGGAERYVHLPTVAGDGCEGSKLRYWGLVEQAPDRRDDGGQSGWWKITDRGANWLTNRTVIQKYARIFDGECLGLEGELVRIEHALGEKFNYEELMAA